MNDQHFTMRQSLAKNVKKMMRGHGYNTDTDDLMAAPKQSNFTSSMFQSNKKDDTSMLWNDRHMSFNTDPRSDFHMSTNKGRVSNINMLTQQPVQKVQKEDSDDDSHSHQSYRPSSFQLLEDLKEEDEEEEEFQKLQADEKRKREAKEGLVPQLTIDNGSTGRNSTASVLYGVNSQFDLDNGNIVKVMLTNFFSISVIFLPFLPEAFRFINCSFERKICNETSEIKSFKIVNERSGF